MIEGSHALYQLLDIFDTMRMSHLSDRLNLLCAGFNTPMAHKKIQKLPGWDSKRTLRWVELPLILMEVVKCFLQISDQSRGILGLDDYIIYVGFYITTDLFA
jgi:hypothetical protein